mmetsp:Transcript_9863/g.21687  ORF Transcript_9863/g.21687 Transcript_9863/m.21687 type:complete len:211 (-) Transcript_9863:887-1519(-)
MMGSSLSSFCSRAHRLSSACLWRSSMSHSLRRLASSETRSFSSCMSAVSLSREASFASFSWLWKNLSLSLAAFCASKKRSRSPLSLSLRSSSSVISRLEDSTRSPQARASSTVRRSSVEEQRPSLGDILGLSKPAAAKAPSEEEVPKRRPLKVAVEGPAPRGEAVCAERRRSCDVALARISVALRRGEPSPDWTESPTEAPPMLLPTLQP